MTLSIFRTFDIVQPRTFKRYTVHSLKIVYHDIPDKFGELIRTKIVEYVVAGKLHEWRNWALFSEFVTVNPDLKLDN